MTAPAANVVRIGEAAARAGLSIDAIRFYERRGLVPPAQRAPSRYRLFTDSDIGRLRFIRRAQAMGFSLREIRQLAALRTRDSGGCAAARDLLRAKLAGVRERRRELARLERELTAALAACERELRRHRGADAAQCPVLRPTPPLP